MRVFRNYYGPFALVTGASSGIGWGFAEELAERGLNLVLTARRFDRLEALANRLNAQHGIDARICKADLAAPSAAAKLLEFTSNLDVGLVVSNAGFGMKGPHEGTDAAEITDMLMVNCNAPMLLARGFVPRLKTRAKGGFIFTSSVEAMLGCPFSAAYSASKALVVAFGEALWGELAGTGIDVLTLCPGATESEAAAKQGIELSKLQHVLTGRQVARLTLDNIGEGPTYFSSEYYKASFGRLLSMPRRDALKAMAQGMKQGG